ncbi:MAG: DoxX family protein [Acidobacteria bacterium]|jgi:putative oxidoreductase|nr:DoxX family protein [Acidobacteriota bacterium]
MEFRETLQRASGMVDRITASLAFIAPLATRLVIGLAFFRAGSGKFRNFENVIGFFDSLGIPFPAFNAGLVASMETVGGLMLIVGLFTRFFASGLAVTMVVALLTADTADLLAAWSGASQISPTDVTAFTFLLFLMWLVFYGAGKLSLDALMKKFLLSHQTPVGSLNPDNL